MNAKTAQQIENLKNQTIGVEIEMNNITRNKAGSTSMLRATIVQRMFLPW